MKIDTYCCIPLLGGVTCLSVARGRTLERGKNKQVDSLPLTQHLVSKTTVYKNVYVFLKASTITKSPPIGNMSSMDGSQSMYGGECDVSNFLIIDQHTFEGWLQHNCISKNICTKTLCVESERFLKIFNCLL